MENQNEEHGEHFAPANDATLVLQYRPRAKLLERREPLPLHVPDIVSAATAAAVAVGMVGCAWLSITARLHETYCGPVQEEPGRRGISANNETIEMVIAVSLVYLAVAFGACYGARAYWARWRASSRPSTLDAKCAEADPDSIPVARRADDDR